MGQHEQRDGEVRSQEHGKHSFSILERCLDASDGNIEDERGRDSEPPPTQTDPN